MKRKNQPESIVSLYITTREEWRSWLEKHYETSEHIWLIYYKKHTGKPRIPYDAAVEEALCFGWIDGKVKRIDDERYMQKYTPRRKRSTWSDSNKIRVEKMISQGRMTEAGLRKIKDAKENGQWNRAYPEKAYPEIPADLEQALGADAKAESNFNNLASCYKKHYIWWITEAKKPETRQRRIRITVQRIAENKKPGTP